jgi:hypothetical protein
MPKRPTVLTDNLVTPPAAVRSGLVASPIVIASKCNPSPVWSRTHSYLGDEICDGRHTLDDRKLTNARYECDFGRLPCRKEAPIIIADDWIAPNCC